MSISVMVRSLSYTNIFVNFRLWTWVWASRPSPSSCSLCWICTRLWTSWGAWSCTWIRLWTWLNRTFWPSYWTLWTFWILRKFLSWLSIKCKPVAIFFNQQVSINYKWACKNLIECNDFAHYIHIRMNLVVEHLL